MNCKEFRSFLETSITSDASSSADGSEHISVCAECRGLFEVQLEIVRHLGAVRDSAPQVPTSLDAAMLANYRRRMAEQTARGDEISLRKWIAPKALAWSVTAVAGLLIIGLLTFAIKRNTNTTTRPYAVELAKAPSLNPSAAKPATSDKTKARTAHADVPKVRHAQPAFSTSAPSPSDGFRSLMYCDQLSCAEAMQVIRVQLPNSFARPMQTSASTNDIVFADVLVGPDGIARGIRIVE